MRNRFFPIIILIIAMPTTLFGQWSNLWTNYSVYGSCFATSADVCFIAGSMGKIFRTTDGGQNWDSTQTVFTSSWFNDIYFPSVNTGYACGGTAFGMHNSTIAKTIDGGQTWDSITSNVFGYDFTKIFFLNDSVGFFCGDYLVKTTDGGLTFSTISFPVFGRVSAISFFDATNGCIAINEYHGGTNSKWKYHILNTTDGGLQWTTSFLDSSDNPSSPGYKNINEIFDIIISVKLVVSLNKCCTDQFNPPSTVRQPSTGPRRG